jgi:hypothetical protein
VFYQQEEEDRDRMLYVMNLKIQNLLITDLDLFSKVKERFKAVSFPTVLRDINVVERMIANDLNPSGDPMKTFTRYFIVENAKKAIARAEEKGDTKAIAMLLGTIGRNMLTDKEDVVKLPYDQIVPFLPEITSDPSVLGIELPADFEEKRQSLREKYRKDYENFIKKLSAPEVEILKNDDDGEDS